MACYRLENTKFSLLWLVTASKTLSFLAYGLLPSRKHYVFSLMACYHLENTKFSCLWFFNFSKNIKICGTSNVFQFFSFRTYWLTQKIHTKTLLAFRVKCPVTSARLEIQLKLISKFW